MSDWFNSAFMSAVGATWVPILLDAALKGAVILALAGIATLMMRRACAAGRHLVWSVAVVSSLLLPALSVVLPGWGVLPQWADLTARTASRSPSLIVPETSTHAVATYAPLSPAAPVAASVVPSPDSASFSEQEATLPVAWTQRSTVPPTPIKAEPVAGGASRVESVHWAWAVALAAWAVGALVVVAGWCLGIVTLLRLCRATSRITDASWVNLVKGLSEQLHLRQSVVMLRGGRGLMPMTWGILRPRLVVPEEAGEWEAQQRRLVLLHELAHVKRRDYVTQLMTRAACALYWFNPLVWIASRRIVVERERACDDLVLATGWEPSEYAEQLLRVVSGLESGASAASAAIPMARPSGLEGRFRAILDARRSRRVLTRLTIAVVLIAAGCFVVPLGIIRPVAKVSAVSITIETDDGSRISGQPEQEVLLVDWASVGKVRLALDHVDSIEFDGERKTASISLSNGDSLQGRLDLDHLDLDTSFAKLSIPMAHVVRITRGQVPVYDPNNGHWYAVVNEPSSWEKAKVRAETLYLQGMRGHLATLTSAEENA